LSGLCQTWYLVLIRTSSSLPGGGPGRERALGRLPDAELWPLRESEDAARAELIRRHLPLARGLAARYRNPNEPFDDLVQVASLGLVKAVTRFDPAMGRPFIAFAAPTILGELKRHFRDTSWSVHVPRGALELSLKVQAGAEDLARNTGRSPSITELAAHLELDTERVLDGLETAGAHYSDSLDAPAAGGDESDAGTISVGDRLGEVDHAYDDVEVRSSLAIAMRQLPLDERRALVLRLEHGLKQSEIAELLGCSQMHVSRLLRRAGSRLRETFEPTL
jgi:RNA polymerase sigma-B factor